MSTLKLDTLSNKAGTASVPSETIVSGTAKAWVNFNGDVTPSIRSAFNVSSITDNGVGRYIINFTVPMIDSNYVFTITAQKFDSNDDRNILLMSERKGGATRSSSTLHVDAGNWLIGGYTGQVSLEPTMCNVAVFR